MMKKTIPKISAMFIACITLCINSCTPGSCFDETNAYVKATMYRSDNGKTATPDSLTLYGLNKESDKIYKRSASAGKINLPLNSASEICTFIIKINNTVDTLTFNYSNYPHFLSKECGYTYYHDLTSVPVFTRHIIDTIMVRQNKITTVNEENIRIYY